MLRKNSIEAIVIIQARTNSSRLPAKVLLPIGGIPIAVLAARRAANTGKKVILATSDQSFDDALVRIAIESGIDCYRGSLDNTLGRFVAALTNYEDNTLVFRLTADNVFPDGKLLDEIQSEFLKQSFDYIVCNKEESGLPYGVSVELTYLRHLRKAYAETQEPYDLEHVTPYLRRLFGDNYFKKYEYLKCGHLRSTIDDIYDYLTMQEVFRTVMNPFEIGFLELIEKLRVAPYQPAYGKKVPKFVLGTAQLGAEYGITNFSGKPNDSVVQQIIENAIINGVNWIDTAAVYGDSELKIGKTLSRGWRNKIEVITKLAPLTECPENASQEIVNAFVDSSVFRSCRMLNTQVLDSLLLHRAVHMWQYKGEVWQRLVEHKKNGVIQKLGVSIQSPNELVFALENHLVELIQLPFNILDWRWESQIPLIKEARKERNLIVHARSVLLQGLLTSTDLLLWRKANIQDAESVIQWITNTAKALKYKNAAELCISFVNSLSWLDGIVIGIETLDQMNQNIKTLLQEPLPSVDIDYIYETRPILSEDTLNPALWKN